LGSTPTISAQRNSISQALKFINDIKPKTDSQAFYRLENEKKSLAAANMNPSTFCRL